MKNNLKRFSRRAREGELTEALYGQSEGFRAQLDWAGRPQLVEGPAGPLVDLIPPAARPRQRQQGA